MPVHLYCKITDFTSWHLFYVLGIFETDLQFWFKKKKSDSLCIISSIESLQVKLFVFSCVVGTKAVQYFIV